MQFQQMAGHLLRLMHQRSVQLFAARMKALGLDLTPVQFAALSALESQPGLDQAGLAQAIAADKATMGGVVSRMEKKGWIARTVAEADRRARVLTLTPEGAALLTTVSPQVAALQDEILGGLDAKERATFYTLAGKVCRDG